MMWELFVYFGEIEDPFHLLAWIESELDNSILKLSHRIPYFLSMGFLQGIDFDQESEKCFFGSIQTSQSFHCLN